MIQQKDTALTFYGFFTQDGVGDTGLTVTVDVYEATTATPIVSAGSATELAGGLYYYTLSSGSVDANAMYITIFKTTDTDTDQKQIPAAFFTPVWADRIDDSIADLATDVATVDTVVDAIKLKTDNIPASPATEAKQDTIIGYIDTEVSAIKAKTDNLPSSPAAVSDIPTAAAIRTEIDNNSTQLAAIVADTNELQTNQDNWLTATGFSTHSAADVVTAMQAVANDFKADVSGLATAANLATVDTVVDGIKTTTDKLDDTLEDDAGTYRFTTNALEQAPTGGSAPTAADIADAVWDEAASGHTSTGTFGKVVNDVYSTQIFVSGKVDNVKSVVDDIKVTTDKLDDTLELDGAVYRFTENSLEQAPSGTGASAASIADAVLDELLADHTGAGSLGKAVADIVADTNELQTNQDNWLTATGFSTHSAADVVSAMQAVANDFKADVSALATAANLATVDNVVDAIKLKTDNLPTSPAAVSDIPTAADNADAVWDEVITGATHNDPTSAGRRLRELTDIVVHSGTAQGGASTYITLAADASAVNDTYDPGVISIVAGTGAGQTRSIYEYNGINKRAYVGRDWRITPDATSEYIIVSDTGNGHVNEGVARGATSTSITLNTLASATDDLYNDQIVFIVAGTGADQARRITDYNGTTKVATVEAWDVTPSTDSVYAVLPYLNSSGGTASIDYDEVASAVLDATATDYNTAGTIGNKINSAASAGDPWTTDLSGYASGTAGAIIRRMGAALETTNAIITKSASVRELNIRRGDTLPAAFSGLGDITGYTDIWFTVKRDPSNADSAAEIQVTGDGLAYINGVAATAANGSITVSDAAAGDISITVAAVETAKLAIRSGMYYDLQVKVGGVVSTIAAGRAHVIYDVTKSV